MSEQAAVAGAGPLVRPDKTAPEGYERDSTISDALQILVDPWRFLIIREAFFGAERFNAFASSLGLPRATLAKSLARLVEAGVMEQHALGGGGSWKRYVLSGSGRDLFAPLLGLMWYGDKWLWEGVPPLALFHEPSRTWFSPRLVWEHDRSPVDPRTVRFLVEDGYWRPREDPGPRSHRIDREGRMRGWRPCSMERTLALVGDRWTFLIFQEFFHGNKRFEEFSRNLNIASNILADRLEKLVAAGFLDKLGEPSPRYRLTAKGWDIYGPMVLLKSWGDRWLRDGARITSRYVSRRTGEPTRAIVVVPATDEPVRAEEVIFVPNYGPYLQR